MKRPKASVSPAPLLDRLRRRVEVSTNGCWLWIGARDPGGYGTIGVLLPTGKRATRGTHRIAYELLRGPIPDGMHLDHLCRVRHCVNPDHLEPVTKRENTMRGISFSAVNAAKSECAQGHPLVESNVYPYRGSRRCRACRREWSRTYRARQSVKVLGEGVTS